LIGFWLWSFQRFGGDSEALSFGRSRAKIWDRSSQQKAAFAGVAGGEVERGVSGR
jgi:hypothetical protein